MKVIDLEQRSAEWFEWRAARKMASESAALLGASPFDPDTPYKLFEIKTGKRRIFENPAMRFGTDFEDAARKYCESKLGLKFDPVCGEHDDEFAASFDGWNADEYRILEIKIPYTGPASKLWQGVAMSGPGGVPLNYQIQCNHQMLVAEADTVDFAVYDAVSDNAVITKIYRDDFLIDQIIEAWEPFWKKYQRGEPPELCDYDYLILDDSDIVATSREYVKAKREFDKAKARLEKVKSGVVELCGNQNVEVPGILRVSTFERKGSVDYKAIPELADVDLEYYRGGPSQQTRITIKGK